MKDAISSTYDFANATNELADAMNNMSESMVIALNKSKLWTIISRMTSGSDFWKLQNKIKAITDGFVLYDNNQKKAIENSKKYAKNIKLIGTLMKDIPTDFDASLLGQAESGKLKGRGRKAISLKDLKTIEQIRGQELYKAFQRVGKQMGVGGKMAADFAQEQIEMQQNALERMNKKLEWQIKLDKGDIRTRLSVRREQLQMLFKGLVGRINTFIMVTIPAIVTTFASVLGTAAIVIPIIAVGIAAIVALTKLTIKLLKSGLESTALGIDNFVSYFTRVATWLYDILMGFYTIFKYAFQGKLIKTLIASLKLVFVTIVVKGALLLAEGIGLIIGAAVGLIIGAIKETTETIKDYFSVRKRFKDFTSGDFGLRRRASGGMAGGMTMVGESGPEMVYLPNGSRVVSSPNSRRGAGATVNVYVNGRVGASDAEINDIAQKVGRAINIQMNRNTNSGVRF